MTADVFGSRDNDSKYYFLTKPFLCDYISFKSYISQCAICCGKKRNRKHISSDLWSTNSLDQNSVDYQIQDWCRNVWIQDNSDLWQRLVETASSTKPLISHAKWQKGHFERLPDKNLNISSTITYQNWLMYAEVIVLDVV